MKIAVIGDGIAAKAFLYQLNQINAPLDITQVTSGEIIPCSINSTAVVALRATEAGISPLGDLIVQAYEKFENFYANFSGRGIELAKEYSTSQTEENFNEKVLKRYKKFSDVFEAKTLSEKKLDLINPYVEEKAYLIYPELFLQSLTQSYSDNLKINKIEDEIIHQTDMKLIGKIREYGPFDNIIYCMGRIPQFLSQEKSQPVAGTYLEFSGGFQDQFSLNCDGKHYMQKSWCTIYGSTTNTDSSLVDEEGIKKIFNDYSVIKKSQHKFNQGTIRYGIRYKGKKRMPMINSLTPNTYCIANLYKNGWSMAFLAAEKIIRELGLVHS